MNFKSILKREMGHIMDNDSSDDNQPAPQIKEFQIQTQP